ncbi:MULTISPECIES: hypothetical protein [unclassified Streptomyces]|uniref:Rv1733c family protein n=1 Tax=unclassified Streptomyces TaxID=2593676 RepID=UPI001F03C584|nr:MULTISPECIES: hypothetical protein [unclassified Streptomyces]MCH0562411.1 hypothetical protein [Streptomyces sp. MUM 2J]MCH0570501.1 hypothetical protein [Streptomyces sp. MUM 136J]
MAFRGPKVWLWRWRRNPLKRRADKVEAWVLLGTWTVTVLVGVLAGLATARTVEQGLARERAEARLVTAHLTARAPGRPTSQDGDSGGERVWAQVEWTAPNGSARFGQVRTAPGTPVGTPVALWTDPRGRLVTKPATAEQARLRSGLVGALGGISAAAVPCAAGHALRRRLEWRRLDQWDVAWARFDPLWRGRTG